MRWRLWSLVCVVTMVNACGGDEGAFTDPGARFEVGVGDRFTVVLESNATTGFAWQLERELPESVVKLVRDEYLEPESNLVGAAGRQELTFEAVGDGSTFIQLWYIRAFDDPPEPADRAQFEVIVGSGVDDEPGDLDTSDETNAISVAELLEESPEGLVYVRGALFDDGSGLRLCDALAESFPPQCPGDAVFISNPEWLDDGFTEEAGVRWTDQPVVLFGELVDGEFRLPSAGLPPSTGLSGG